jgi:Na+-driven multidrug efflux pump
MKDLTEGSIYRHLVTMAGAIAGGMLLQTLYYVVDLHFVARLGDAAIAGVGAAGNVMFAVLALTQMLGIGSSLRARAPCAQAYRRQSPYLS